MFSKPLLFLWRILFIISLTIPPSIKGSATCPQNELFTTKIGGEHDNTFLSCLDYRQISSRIQDRVLIGGGTKSQDIAQRNNKVYQGSAILIQQDYSGLVLWKKVINIEGADAFVHECEMNDFNVFATIGGGSTINYYSIFILDHDGNVAKSIKMFSPSSYQVSPYSKTLTIVEDALFLLMWTNQNGDKQPIFVQFNFTQSQQITPQSIMMNMSSYIYSGSIDETKKIMKIGLIDNEKIDIFFTSRFKNINNQFEASISKILIDRLNSSYFNVTQKVLYCDSTPSSDPNLVNYHFSDFDLKTSSTPGAILYFIGYLSDDGQNLLGQRITVKHPTITLGIIKSYKSTGTEIDKVLDIQITSSYKIFLYVRKKVSSTSFQDSIAHLQELGSTIQLTLTNYLNVNNGYQYAEFKIKDETSFLYIFTVNQNFNSQFGQGNKQAGFMYKYPKGFSSTFDCRNTFTQQTLSSFTIPADINILEGPLNENKVTTGQILTMANLSSLQTLDMLTIRRTDNPLSCQPPRKIPKAPPVISSIIVHDANSSSQGSFPFYPDVPDSTLSSCDNEGLHFELRTSVLGLEVPHQLSIVNNGGDYRLVIDTAEYMVLPITYNLSIAQVDLYGDYVQTDFKLKITNLQQNENCSLYQVWSPIIQDFTYVIGSLQWLKYEFVQQDDVNKTMECYPLLQYNLIVVNSKGKLTNKYPFRLESDNKRFRLETSNSNMTGLYKVKFEVVNPTINPNTKLVNTAVTNFQVLVMLKENDSDFPCRIIAPIIEDYHFDVSSLQPSFYKLPVFTFSSISCQQMFDSFQQTISYSIFQDIKRPEEPQTKLTSNCFEIFYNGENFISMNVWGGGCNLAYEIRIEAFLQNSQFRFRRLANITNFIIHFTSSSPCFGKTIVPSISHPFTRYKTIIYYDIRGQVTKSPMTIRHQDYLIQNSTCSISNITSFDRYYSPNLIVFNQQIMNVNTNQTVITTLNNKLHLGDYLLTSIRHNSEYSFQAQMYFLIKIFDSQNCEIQLNGNNPQFVTLVIDQNPVLEPINMKLMSLRKNGCMYNQIYYNFELSEGDLRTTNFVKFSTNSTDNILNFLVPKIYDFGVYQFYYTGYLNPYLKLQSSFRIIVKYPRSYQNTGAPIFQSKVQDITMRANIQQQFRMPAIFDIDGDNVTCSGFYQINNATLPPWALFRTQNCNWVFSPTDQDWGEYVFTVVLTDDNQSGQKSSSYRFKLNITESLQYLEEIRKSKMCKNENFTVPFTLGAVTPNGTVTVEFGEQSQIITADSNVTKIKRADILIQIEYKKTHKRETLKWKAIDFNYSASSLTIQLYFLDPSIVSANKTKDILRVQFQDCKFFIRKQDGHWPDEKLQMTKEIPKQYIPETQNFIKSKLNAFQKALNSLIFGNLGVNIVMSASLQLLWGMINTLQIMVIAPLFNLSYSDSSIFFFQFIVKITRCDIFPAETIIKYFLTFNENEDQKMSSNFEQLGYRSTSCILNLETIFLITIGSLAIIFLVLILKLTVYRLFPVNGFLMRYFDSLYKTLFFDYIIRFFLEGYIELMISSLLNIPNLSYESSGEYFSAIFSQIFCGILIFFPFVILFFIFGNHEILEKSFLSRKFGSLWEGINHKKSKWAALYNFFFTFRRLILIIITIYLQDLPQIQLELFIFMSILNSSYLMGVKPFELPSINRVELFNELCISAMAYTLIILTDFVENPDQKEIGGYVVIGIISFNFLANIAIIIRGMFQRLILFCKNINVFWAKLQQKVPFLKRKAKISIEEIQRIEFENFKEEYLAHNISNITHNKTEQSYSTRQTHRIDQSIVFNQPLENDPYIMRRKPPPPFEAPEIQILKPNSLMKEIQQKLNEKPSSKKPNLFIKAFDSEIQDIY